MYDNFFMSIDANITNLHIISSTKFRLSPSCILDEIQR